VIGGCPEETHRWPWPWLRLLSRGFWTPRCCFARPGIGLGIGDRRRERLALTKLPAGPCRTSRLVCFDCRMASTASAGGAGGDVRAPLVAAAAGTDLAEPRMRRICPTLSDLAGWPPLEAAAAAAGRCRFRCCSRGRRRGGPPRWSVSWQLLAAAGRRCPAPDWETCWPDYAAGTGAAAGCREGRGPALPLRPWSCPGPAWRAARTGRGRSDAPGDGPAVGRTCGPGGLVEVSSLIKSRSVTLKFHCNQLIAEPKREASDSICLWVCLHVRPGQPCC